MDINFGGIIFLWLALLWPIITVSYFVKSKIDDIKNNTAFFVVSFLVAYLLGYIFCFSIIYAATTLVEQADKTIVFMPYLPVALIFVMPPVINYNVYFIFLKFKNKKIHLDKTT